MENSGRGNGAQKLSGDYKRRAFRGLAFYNSKYKMGMCNEEVKDNVHFATHRTSPSTKDLSESKLMSGRKEKAGEGPVTEKCRPEPEGKLSGFGRQNSLGKKFGVNGINAGKEKKT